MRTYTVQPGDTPSSIAARDDMAGCPKCSVDLVRANSHKPTVVFPNGFITFKDLHAGEKLNVPAKWSSPEFNQRSPTYFAALPYMDGKTPSKLGVAAAGVLGDFGAFDTASVAASALAQLSDQQFVAAVEGVATLIDQSVREADSSSNPAIVAYAQAVHISTNAARQRNLELVAAIAMGDQAGATKARLDIQNDLLTAINSAQLALQAVYGTQQSPAPLPVPTPTPAPAPSLPKFTFPPAIVTAAQAVATAIASDPNFCAAVAQQGSAVNTAVHAFKAAYNAVALTNDWAPLPINTGNYEQATANVLTQVLGHAPPACAAKPTPSPLPSPPPFVVPVTPPQQQQAQGLSTGAVLGLGVLGAGVVGGAIYLATRAPSPSSRIKRFGPDWNEAEEE